MNVIEIQSLLHDYNQLLDVYVLVPLFSWQKIYSIIITKTQEYIHNLDKNIKLKIINKITLTNSKMNEQEKNRRELNTKVKFKFNEIETEIERDNKEINEFIDSALKDKIYHVQNVFNIKLNLTKNASLRNMNQKRYKK